MAAILFARTIHCPWCSTQVPVSQGWNLQSFVSWWVNFINPSDVLITVLVYSSTCGRKFSTSSTNSVQIETVLEEYGRVLNDELYGQSLDLLVDEYTRPKTVSRQVSFRLVHLMLMPLDLARAGLVGKKIAKKPLIACLFCLGRKIACGPPSASGGAAGESGGSGTTSGPRACK
jgi:hypothetical protein